MRECSPSEKQGVFFGIEDEQVTDMNASEPGNELNAGAGARRAESRSCQCHFQVSRHQLIPLGLFFGCPLA